MAAGDVEGFAAVAFPIVRRVFGGLLANDLVSVQPMSLPSGLIFFLDFTKTNVRLGQPADVSVYGGAKVGSQITGGVDLTNGAAGAVGGIESGLYNLNNGYSSPVKGRATTAADLHIATSGAINANGEFQEMTKAKDPLITETQAREILRYDPDITSGTGVVIIKTLASNFDQLNKDNLQSIAYMEAEGQPLSGAVGQSGLKQARRLTGYLAEDTNREYIYAVFTTSASVNVGTIDQAAMKNIFVNGQITKSLDYVQFNSADDFTNAAVGGVKGTADWLLESTSTTVSGEFGDDLEAIPEIDIKVDSVAVTAVTKKLRAKWSPELGQDLNAYHNLDAEVELTGILSEQVALEIDREILEDLIKRATAGTLHWSRNPGQFLNRETGAEVGAASAAPDFTGTVSEWYETLIETINDVSARIHRKTLRGGANFIVCSPEVANLLEFTAGFRAAVSVDSNGTAGAVNVGSISKKFDVHVDPYFPRNLVLVGRKGASFLESGYVYAPYVPLQVTPTIFGTEDFAPRKGVMTRYAKKMVRPDMYGLVICHDLVG